MNAFLLVGGGGVLGALARYAVDRRLAGRRGTVVVNVLGSVVLGSLTATPLGTSAMLVVGAGFCGAFTTFSSFAVDVAEFVENGEWRLAAGYAGGTLAAALVGVVVGSWLGRVA
ncbi:fluoride efflux transporter FluC [Salinirarus marinus]|uniref:fluoride efflux transporter FluC n=1 Tax=Salinirarus marinus TaxID=3068310 RepID=UPI003C6C055D